MKMPDKQDDIVINVTPRGFHGGEQVWEHADYVRCPTVNCDSDVYKLFASFSFPMADGGMYGQFEYICGKCGAYFTLPVGRAECQKEQWGKFMSAYHGFEKKEAQDA